MGNTFSTKGNTLHKSDAEFANMDLVAKVSYLNHLKERTMALSYGENEDVVGMGMRIIEEIDMLIDETINKEVGL